MRKAITAFAAVMLFSGVALPHSNDTKGWAYDPDCCSDRDCAAVPEGAIRETQGGYSITLSPGEHPTVKHRLEDFLQHGSTRIRVSGDTERHACVWSGRVLCIYVPPGGV